MRKTLTVQESITFSAHATLRPDAVGLRKAQDFLIRILDALGEWQERSAQRQRLAALDSRMLGDLGIDRGTAAAEAAKPFWRS